MKLTIPFLIFLLVSNLVVTMPLTIVIHRVIKNRWINAFIGMILSTAIFAGIFYGLIHFEFLYAHPSAYFVVVGPYALVAIGVSILTSRFFKPSS